VNLFLERLQSCIEKIEDVLGETCQERDMVNAVMNSNYNVEVALDALLNKSMYNVIHWNNYRFKEFVAVISSHVEHIYNSKTFSILSYYNHARIIYLNTL